MMKQIVNNLTRDKRKREASFGQPESIDSHFNSTPRQTLAVSIPHKITMLTDHSRASPKKKPDPTSRLRSSRPLRATRAAMLVAALCGSGYSAAQTAHSRLGTPEVQSSLGSPLWVRIPIEPTVAGEDVSTSRFMLGTRPVNSALPFLESGEVGFERVGDRYFLVIRSRQSIDEPAIGLVIREQIPNGIRSREFTLLIDPPTMGNARPPERAATSPAAESVYMAAQSVQTIAAPKPVSTTPMPEPATSQTVQATPPPQWPRPRRSRAATTTVEAAAAEAPVKSIAPTAIAKPDNRVRPAARSTKVAGAGSSGPRLTLSLGEGLNERTTASEAERAELRMRRMMLDLDDLTASLLERQNRISQLEKELAGLAARMGAAERLIAGGSTAAGKPGDIAPLAVAQNLEQTPATAANAPEMAGTPAAAPTPAKTAPAGEVTPPTRSNFSWNWLALGVAAIALFALMIGKLRAVIARRAESYRLVPQQADDYVAEVLSRDSAKPQPAPAAYTKTVKMTAAPLAHPPASPQPVTPIVHEAPAPIAEIHFELPETPPQTHEVGQTMEVIDTTIDFDLNETSDKAAAEDLRSRRMRYLQSRYQDIAILMPPIDAPQRLLRQAGTVYDEGAADFAKRLLKYAAYSRPYAEEFWLALLELLYREKLASDYIVNAKWFRQHLPASTQWKEVVRIGYLLDPAEPLFVEAAHWSHDEPAAGTWLPATPADQKPSSPLPHLTLELAN